MTKNIYSDLASEFLKSKSKPFRGVCSVSEINIDKALASKIGKAEGRYITVETDCLYMGKATERYRLSKALCEVLTGLLGGRSKVLVVGLGNESLTADALGGRVCARIHSDGENLMTLKPSVCGLTGIESFDIVKGVCDRVKPDKIIVIDSLSAAATSRIGRVVQFSDAGITPGSGVSNHRKRLDEDSLGVKVISVGVPLVVHATTIIEEAKGYSKGFGNMIVTPKDIDIIVTESAEIIASAINRLWNNV